MESQIPTPEQRAKALLDYCHDRDVFLRALADKREIDGQFYLFLPEIAAAIRAAEAAAEARERAACARVALSHQGSTGDVPRLIAATIRARS
jgi:hypothetical protein